MSTAFNPALIERPDPRLMQYYFYCSLLAVPAFPIAILNLWLRYVTLRYKFDDDGVSMSHGVFFRREVNLTFRRIQDIHLTRNLLQRWMGLATISLQTASGNAQAELTIEGVLEAEALRDYLYSRMRGARDEHLPVRDVVTATVHSPSLASNLPTDGASTAAHAPDNSEPVLQTLVEIRDALKLLVDRQGVRS
jgi:uncharacterized membrane protein YdbT with pleckstrin-like domain